MVGIFQETHSFGSDDEEIIHRVHIVSDEQFNALSNLLDKVENQKITEAHPMFAELRAQYEQLRALEPSFPLLREADYDGVPEYWP